MTRKEFADMVAAEYGTSKVIAEQWVSAICHTLLKAVLENDVVKLHGFGYFEHRERAAKVGRMPSGERIDIPARTKLVFVPSAYLDNAIRFGMTYEEFEAEMEIFRALKRGEKIPGYKIYKEHLIRVPVEE